jgi:hypothetical protein
MAYTRISKTVRLLYQSAHWRATSIFTLLISANKCLAFLLTITVFVPTLATGQENENVDAAIIGRVLAPFRNSSIDDIFDYLDKIRVARVSKSDKEVLLRDIPLVTAKTRINDQREIFRVQTRVRAVLALHQRAQTIEFIIFRYEQPVILTKPGVVIAISTRFLDLVGGDDAALSGAVSHEIAHQYVALEIYGALQRGDMARLRELELFCDAIAVASLIALGMDPARYSQLLKKVMSFSPEAVKLNDGHGETPSLATRLKLIGEVQKVLLGHDSHMYAHSPIQLLRQ